MKRKYAKQTFRPRISVYDVTNICVKWTGTLFWQQVRLSNNVKMLRFYQSILTSAPSEVIQSFFSTLYTTLPHHLIKDKLIHLINRTFIRENTLYLACNEECAFFTSGVYNNHNLWSCQNVCDALVYLLDSIFIRFGTKLYRQTIGIPMGI